MGTIGERGAPRAVRQDVLIGADELHDALRAPDAPVVVDVRWALGRTDGRERYLAAHIPQAVFADLERELAAPPSPAQGRHPLPDPSDFQAAARRWGISATSSVVVYDDVAGLSAARAWWLLRWAGHDRVRILDGGLAAWQEAGYPTGSGEHTRPPGDFVARPGAMPTLDADGAARAPASGILLDARAAERYRGDTEPVDPRAGHIPGARNAPTTDNLAANGRFLADRDLRARFAGLGVDAGRDVAVYCGSGVTAAHQIAALAAVGIPAALYPGSWSQWSADPDRPVATG